MSVAGGNTTNACHRHCTLSSLTRWLLDGASAHVRRITCCLVQISPVAKASRNQPSMSRPCCLPVAFSNPLNPPGKLSSSYRARLITTTDTRHRLSVQPPNHLGTKHSSLRSTEYLLPNLPDTQPLSHVADSGHCYWPQCTLDSHGSRSVQNVKNSQRHHGDGRRTGTGHRSPC